MFSSTKSSVLVECSCPSSVGKNLGLLSSNEAGLNTDESVDGSCRQARFNRVTLTFIFIISNDYRFKVGLQVPSRHILRLSMLHVQ